MSLMEKFRIDRYLYIYKVIKYRFSVLRQCKMAKYDFIKDKY